MAVWGSFCPSGGWGWGKSLPSLSGLLPRPSKLIVRRRSCGRTPKAVRRRSAQCCPAGRRGDSPHCLLADKEADKRQARGPVLVRVQLDEPPATCCLASHSAATSAIAYAPQAPCLSRRYRVSSVTSLPQPDQLSAPRKSPRLQTVWQTHRTAANLLPGQKGGTFSPLQR